MIRKVTANLLSLTFATVTLSPATEPPTLQSFRPVAAWSPEMTTWDGRALKLLPEHLANSRIMKLASVLLLLAPKSPSILFSMVFNTQVTTWHSQLGGHDLSRLQHGSWALTARRSRVFKQTKDERRPCASPWLTVVSAGPGRATVIGVGRRRTALAACASEPLSERGACSCAGGGAGGKWMAGGRLRAGELVGRGGHLSQHQLLIESI